MQRPEAEGRSTKRVGEQGEQLMRNSVTYKLDLAERVTEPELLVMGTETRGHSAFEM